MKKVYKNWTYLLVVLIFTACAEQLEVEPTSVITTKSFWKTEDDAQGALTGMYVNLRNVANQNLYYLGEARSDVITLGTVGDGGWSKYYYNSLNSVDAGPSWQSFYTLVNSANLIIKYVPNIEFASEDKKNSILAQAYAMRAFTYFVMVRTWGKLPMRTEPTEGSDAETTQIERSPVGEIFKLIKEDIDQALQLFPNNNFQKRHLWSKPAANALKANVYLWTGKKLNGGETDINTALAALNDIEAADVSLLSKYSDVFDFDNKGNKEILMAVRFEEFEVGSNYFRDMYIIGSAIPTNIDEYTRELIGPVGSGNNIVVPTETLKAQFTEDDTRKASSFYEVFTYDDQGEATYYTTIVQKGVGTVSGGSRLFLSDVILYRYADVLLMKAEAKNALGQDPSTEINMIRQRAYGDNFDDYVFVSRNKEENDEAILKERYVELAFEGKRWWDLIRFGKAIEKLPSLQDKENPEHLLLFPISNSVLSLEPKVQQNPGYN
jgi:hypothetical protein